MDYGEFMRLFEPLEQNIFFVILSIVKDREDAEDAYQDVVLKGCLNFKKLRNKASFKPWITKIAVNTAYDHLKKQRRHLDIDAITLPHYDSYHEWDDALKQALDTLSDSERTVVVLRAVQELPYREIAAIVRRPENTVRTVYARAIQKLSDQMNDHEKGGAI